MDGRSFSVGPCVLLPLALQPPRQHDRGLTTVVQSRGWWGTKQRRPAHRPSVSSVNPPSSAAARASSRQPVLWRNILPHRPALQCEEPDATAVATQGDISDVFDTLSGMKALQLLDLSDMSMLKGPLVPPGVAPAQAGLCQLATRRLLVLNLAEIGAPCRQLGP